MHWTGGQRRGLVHRAPLELAEIETPRGADAALLRTKTLCFRIGPRRPEYLEALRAARRAMIREELTRGLAAGEPSLAEATFSPTSILWEVSYGEQVRCRETLSHLVRRAKALVPAETTVA
jgi:hypothetical protein